MADRIVWTPREAFACALCWSGFGRPQDSRTDTPEGYWRNITEQSRNIYRAEAKRRLLVAVARGEAVPLMPSAALREGQLQAFGREAGLIKEHRMRRLIDAMRRALDPKEAKVSEFSDA